MSADLSGGAQQSRAASVASADAWARIVRGKEGEWRFQPLSQHLNNVAGRAAEFAEPLGAAAIASLAGLWHDLGKYAADFQRYLLDANGIDADREEASNETAPGRVDHSAAGALLALRQLGPAGKILAQVIAAHHAGLYDAENLAQRLAGRAERLQAALAGQPPAALIAQAAPAIPRIPAAGDPCGYALWIRMLFSCLVDADVLDSEAFCDPVAASLRSGFRSLAELEPLFDAHMAQFRADTPVQRIRAEVLAACRAAAARPIGIHTLTVPTGGGKTLSSMAFALAHARRHGLRRVIYVIPYTSIIEQTADVLRGIFGDDVVEHHSNIEPDHESARARLASENWDAPVVVTTNVQFFESLFAARPSRCRKLHNIVDSVVVLDEAQLLPPAFLQPIVDVLRLLARHYRTSIVMSTATQPALRSWQNFGSDFRGLDGVEIVPDPEGLGRQMERVSVHLPHDLQQPMSWEAVAGRIAAEPCVLAIVNTRADARQLHALLPSGTLHLSAWMCGAHRADTIATIRRRLDAWHRGGCGLPLRVVSTQLVEAGVDIDFPVVFRALAGLDSIAQAAGRCNREGRLDRGSVHVFVPPTAAPPGLLRLGQQATRSVLHTNAEQPLLPAMYERYFRRLYRDCEIDAAGIVRLLKPVQSGGVVGLRSAADAFRLIDETHVSVLVPYRSHVGDDRFETLRADLRRYGPSSRLMRRLQRFSVSVPKRRFDSLQFSGDIEELTAGIWAVVSEAQYDATLGLLMDTDALAGDALIV